MKPRKQWIRCKMCGELEEQATKGRVRKYCSEACKQRYYRMVKAEGTGHQSSRRHTRRREKKRERQCGICGGVITWEKGKVPSRYCSGRCRQRARTLKENHGMGLCRECGAPFEGSKRQIYCSARCCGRAYERRYEREHRGKRQHRYGKCRECGERFDRIDVLGRINKRFCGELCSHRFLDREFKRQMRERERVLASGKVVK